MWYYGVGFCIPPVHSGAGHGSLGLVSVCVRVHVHVYVQLCMYVCGYVCVCVLGMDLKLQLPQAYQPIATRKCISIILPRSISSTSPRQTKVQRIRVT